MSGTTFSHQLKERRLKYALDTVLVRVVVGEEAGGGTQKTVLHL